MTLAIYNIKSYFNDLPRQDDVGAAGIFWVKMLPDTIVTLSQRHRQRRVVVHLKQVALHVYYYLSPRGGQSTLLSQSKFESEALK